MTRKPICDKCGAHMPDPVLLFSKARIAVSLLCLDCATELYEQDGTSEP